MSEDAAPAPVVKRGRGRPPKVPSDGNEATSGTPKAKRGRGRPPKVKPENEGEPVPKRPRGRPRKIPDANPKAPSKPKTVKANASGDGPSPTKKVLGRPRKSITGGSNVLWPTPNLVQLGGADPFEEYDSFEDARINELAGPEAADESRPGKLAIIKRRLHAEAEKRDYEEAGRIDLDLEYFQTRDDLYSQYAYTRAQVVQLLSSNNNSDEAADLKSKLSTFLGCLRYMRLTDAVIAELRAAASRCQERDFLGAKTCIQALEGPWCIGTAANREIRLKESKIWQDSLARLMEWADGFFNDLYQEGSAL